MLDRRTFIKSGGAFAAFFAVTLPHKNGLASTVRFIDLSRLEQFMRGETNLASVVGSNFRLEFAAEQLASTEDIEDYFYKAYFFTQNEDDTLDLVTSRAYYHKFSVHQDSGNKYFGSEQEIANRSSFVEDALEAHKVWLLGHRPKLTAYEDFTYDWLNQRQSDVEA
jgi:hypothetical protein